MKRILVLLLLMGCSSAFLQIATPNATIYLRSEINATTTYSVMLYCGNTNKSETIDVSLIGNATKYVAILESNLTLEQGRCYNITMIATIPPNETLLNTTIAGNIEAASESSVCAGTQCYITGSEKHLVIYPQPYIPPQVERNTTKDHSTNQTTNYAYDCNLLGGTCLLKPQPQSEGGLNPIFLFVLAVSASFVGFMFIHHNGAKSSEVDEDENKK